MSQPPETFISTRILIRIVVGLIAVWSLVAGIILVGFHGASAGALGAGVADDAGQRLVGAHLLILVPVYLRLIWRTEQHFDLLWLPFAAQIAVALAVGYSIIAGDTAFEDGILAVVISAILAGLLGFIWVTEQRAMARDKLEQQELARASPADETDEPE